MAREEVEKWAFFDKSSFECGSCECCKRFSTLNNVSQQHKHAFTITIIGERLHEIRATSMAHISVQRGINDLFLPLVFTRTQSTRKSDYKHTLYKSAGGQRISSWHAVFFCASAHFRWLPLAFSLFQFILLNVQKKSLEK